METILSKSLIELVKKRSKDFPVEGFVLGVGPVKPCFLLLGEAPGEVESLNGIPFTGRAGKELMTFFDFLNVTREDVFITSTFRSRPFMEKEKTDKKTDEKIIRKYNRPPTKKEIIAHAPLLDSEIKTTDPPIILTMGNIGL
ncbi:uracil-DNA glycosylase family protein [Carnobacterium iners]|uniref:uracil-DNA glycosylase family protein n=1 Tax=Carnobacterium iners TaxID=1073423 RepID=UPI0008D70892|nr:DNA polymerase [Carnobacterium iners]